MGAFGVKHVMRILLFLSWQGRTREMCELARDDLLFFYMTLCM